MAEPRSEILRVPEKNQDLGKPYFYHTTGIENLAAIFGDKKLKDPEGKPISFTSDQIDEQTGELNRNGLTDPAYDILMHRKMEPGRVMFVFDKRVKDNPSFASEDESRRYPQVTEEPTDDALVVIAYEEDMPRVWQEMEANGVDIPIVKRGDWESYAYGGEVGGLAEEEVKSTGGLMETVVVDDDKALGGIAETEVIGGLADTEATPVETKLEQPQPDELLFVPSISVETFFGLNWDEIYAKLHALQSLPDDHPSKQRWMKMVELHEKGEEKFKQENPETREIKF